MKMTFQEIGIIATGLCIANQLRDVNTICRRSWYIAAHSWKIPGLLKDSPYSISLKVYIPIPISCRNIFRLCRKILSDAFSYNENV
jgi:hypothetical protein